MGIVPLIYYGWERINKYLRDPICFLTLHYLFVIFLLIILMIFRIFISGIHFLIGLLTSLSFYASSFIYTLWYALYFIYAPILSKEKFLFKITIKIRDAIYFLLEKVFIGGF